MNQENSYTVSEKVAICTDIGFKLKNFENKKGKVNLFNENYTFVSKLKQIMNDYIKGDQEYSGTLLFEEINKKIKYSFPVNKSKKPLFVIKIK
jgi:hypothetical protein